MKVLQHFPVRPNSTNLQIRKALDHDSDTNSQTVLRKFERALERYMKFNFYRGSSQNKKFKHIRLIVNLPNSDSHLFHLNNLTSPKYHINLKAIMGRVKHGLAKARWTLSAYFSVTNAINVPLIYDFWGKIVIIEKTRF